MHITGFGSRALVRIVAVWSLVLSLGLGALDLGHAYAQDGETSHEFESGNTLAWGGDWEIEPEFTYVEGELEMVSLSTGSANFHVISLPNTQPLNEARDIFLDGFFSEVGESETIDRGDYGAVSYSLDRVESEGVQLGVFMLFRQGEGSSPSFAYLLVTAPEAFAENMSSVQSTMTLDGAPFFDGIDGQGLEDQLLSDESGNQQPADNETPEAAETEVADPEETPAQGDETPADDSGSGSGSKFGGGDDAEETPEADSDETPEAGAEETPEADTDPDGGDTVIEGGESFESEISGATLVWGPYWGLNDQSDQPISSNEADGYDSVVLVGTGDEFALLNVILQAGGSTDLVDGLTEYWQTPDALEASAVSPDAHVLVTGSSATAGWVVWQDYFETSEGVLPVLVFREVRLNEDTGVATISILTTVAPHAAIVIDEASTGVAVDGTPPFTELDLDEVLGLAE